MQSNQCLTANIQRKLHDSLKVIRMFEWLLDSYVLDFYVDNHWQKMPKSWIQTLEKISPEDLTDLLIPPDQKKPTEKVVWPLSLLALRKELQRLCIPRKPCSMLESNGNFVTQSTECINSKDEDIQKRHSNHKDPNNNPKSEFDCLTHPKIKTILMKKNIKEKKRHEIERMSKLTADVAKKLHVKYIVDFGSGVGHLARLLVYGYKLNVCCLEKDKALIEQANELDKQLMDLVNKCCTNEMGFHKLAHLNMCLCKDTSFSDLTQNIRKCFNIESNDTTFEFGIIGLHPCGDLASILINFFLRCPEVKFLNLVGCCYFKITTSTTIDDFNKNELSIGYPLSKYLQAKNIEWHHLSFEAREIACHAIEVYAQRLSQKNYDNLRVHSFRAAIEKIICNYWPEKKHSGLRSIKRLTTFQEYCEQAVSHLDGVCIPQHDIDSSDTIENLNNWKSVVIFYTLRLMLAPIVESVILYDRILCLMENGCRMKINAIFDPIISARNHIITAIRS